MSEFNLEVVTPAGKIFSGRANSVKLPSSKGEIGILPGHIGYVGVLGTGVLELSGSEGSKRMAISGGCVSVEKDTLSILADHAVPSDAVAEDYDAERSALLEKVKELPYDAPEALRAKQKLALIEAVDKLVSN